MRAAPAPTKSPQQTQQAQAQFNQRNADAGHFVTDSQVRSAGGVKPTAPPPKPPSATPTKNNDGVNQAGAQVLLDKTGIANSKTESGSIQYAGVDSKGNHGEWHVRPDGKQVFVAHQPGTAVGASVAPGTPGTAAAPPAAAPPAAGGGGDAGGGQTQQVETPTAEDTELSSEDNRQVGQWQAMSEEQKKALFREYLDKTNPYSRINLLEKQFRERAEGRKNSYANMGQLYSGALQNAAGNDDFDFNDSLNALTGDYQKAIGGVDMQLADLMAGLRRDVAGRSRNTAVGAASAIAPGQGGAPPKAPTKAAPKPPAPKAPAKPVKPKSKSSK